MPIGMPPVCQLLGVPIGIMGMYVVAVGAQIPDTIQAVTVARRGHGSMAVASATGSQVGWNHILVQSLDPALIRSLDLILVQSLDPALIRPLDLILVRSLDPALIRSLDLILVRALDPVLV